ncbi:hypothetical protein KAW55_04570 [bacterium]|nr:hypothetical protein [bacterium]
MPRVERTFPLWDKEHKQTIPVKAIREGRHWKAFCPKHNDKKRSLGINEGQGIFNCLGCLFSGRLYDSRFKEKVSLKDKHRAFLKERGHDYSNETIKHFGLRSEKYHGQEIIYYNLQGVKRYLAINERGIDGTWRSFPGHKVTVIGDFAPKELILVEGEHDLMMGWQKRLAGVCSFTAGAMTVPGPDKLRAFEGKDLVIIYDHDKAGSDGAEKVANAVLEIIHSIKIIQLPVQGDGEDLTDYFYRGGTKEDLLHRIGQLPPWGHPNFKEKDALIEEYRHKIYSTSEVKDTNRDRLFAITYDLIQRANIYTGRFGDTFSAIARPYYMSPDAMKKLLSRHLKAWGFLDWKGKVGKSGKTTFTMKEYPKVRFE